MYEFVPLISKCLSPLPPAADRLDFSDELKLLDLILAINLFKAATELMRK